jgi:hypothetical protein
MKRFWAGNCNAADLLMDLADAFQHDAISVAHAGEPTWRISLRKKCTRRFAVGISGQTHRPAVMK